MGFYVRIWEAYQPSHTVSLEKNPAGYLKTIPNIQTINHLTWSLIPIATCPTLTCRRSRILRHSPWTFSIQMSTPGASEQWITIKNRSRPGYKVIQPCHLTFKAVQGGLIGRGQPLQVSVCLTVAGGKDSRAQIVRRVIRVLKGGESFFFLGFVFFPMYSTHTPASINTHLLWGIHLRCVRAAKTGRRVVSRFRGRGRDGCADSYI